MVLVVNERLYTCVRWVNCSGRCACAARLCLVASTLVAGGRVGSTASLWCPSGFALIVERTHLLKPLCRFGLPGGARLPGLPTKAASSAQQGVQSGRHSSKWAACQRAGGDRPVARMLSSKRRNAAGTLSLALPTLWMAGLGSDETLRGGHGGSISPWACPRPVRVRLDEHVRRTRLLDCRRPQPGSRWAARLSWSSPSNNAIPFQGVLTWQPGPVRAWRDGLRRPQHATSVTAARLAP